VPAAGTRARPAAQKPSVKAVAFSTGRVLALLADPVERLLIDERLSASGEFEVEIVAELEHAIEAAPRYFDAAVVDVRAITVDSAASIGRLIESLDGRPLIVIGDADDPASATSALDAGAHAFVPRALLGSNELLHAIRRAVALDSSRRDLDRLAFTDPLTGLLNRRGFNVIAARALEASERLGSTFTLLFFDIDDLEQINAGYGHSTPAAALREAAGVLASAIRPMDVAERGGDNEVCIALTGGSPPAITVSQRLGRAFDERNRSSEGYLLSLTLGVTEADEWRHPTLDHLVTEAAARMLAA
jgi:diguanylate cyclase (GGDEF)-like protein